MERLNDEELNERINSFISRKHQEYPELALRGGEKRAESIGYLIADKFSELASSIKLARLAH